MSNKNQDKPKAKNKIADVLKYLDPSGARLAGGLALRITTSNGFKVLGCSRIDVAPSDTEMAVMKTAVLDAFGPAWLFESQRTTTIHVHDQAHYIRRLYWPLENIALVHGTYDQPALIGQGGL